jgi:uncharacterized protein
VSTLLQPIPVSVAAQIDAIYARIPKLDCQRKCQECCGPILMSRFEWQRICSQLHREPKGNADLTCPMLKNGTDCRVYTIRPAICRLWGTVEKMACPHGCVPERWLSDDEAHGILNELDALAAAGQERG